jgi:hypothetical protein
MTKKQLIFNILRNLVINPKNIRRVADETDFYSRYLDKKFNIKALPSLDLRVLFPDFDVEIENYSFLEGSSLTIDIAFLRKLASRFENCHYFELGCWRGESLYNVAAVSESCTALSLSKDEMKKMGFPPDIIAQNHFYTKDLNNIKFIHHNSLTFDFNQIEDRFDLLFIDGDHHYESIVSDTKNVLNLRKNDQSIIVWHDYGFNPEMVRPEVLAGILDGLPQHLHKNLVHISNTKCAALIMQDFGDLPLHRYPTNPDKTFDVRISVKGLK